MSNKIQQSKLKKKRFFFLESSWEHCSNYKTLIRTMMMNATTSSVVEPVLYGYDMVAYFTESKPVMGNPEISYVFETEDCGLNDECVPRFNSTFLLLHGRTINKSSWTVLGSMHLVGVVSEVMGLQTSWLLQWPWSRDLMGPPGGPEDSWKIYNDSLILNFLPKIMDNFF